MPARLVPLAVGRTAVAVSGLADSGVVHRLTRGRLWIGALTTLLVGIVSLNVLALSFNASSSRVGRQADGLKREISALRAEIATDGASNERVAAAAAKLGLIVPEPGSVRYLRPSPDDAAAAAKRLASGELGTDASYAAPVSVPTTTSTSPPATGESPVPTQPIAPAPATASTATTTTADAPSPPAGGGASGGAPTGGGGVSAP
jgi:cell division septation protein DedD